MRIRPASASDAAAVAALWTEGYTNRGPGGRKTPYAEREFFDSARAGEVYVVDSVGDRRADPAGRVDLKQAMPPSKVASGAIEPPPDGLLGVVVFHPPCAAAAFERPGEAELSRLVVAGRARGRGIGRALVELCASRAREAGAERLVLWSRPYQTAAHALYGSLGFRRAGERDSADEDGERLVFVKEMAGGRAAQPG